MVATGRQARSAKNRLARSRVSVPVSISAIELPEGCPAQAKDIDELVHGESALQQLCALKSIGERLLSLASGLPLLSILLRYPRVEKCLHCHTERSSCLGFGLKVSVSSHSLWAVAALGIVKGKAAAEPGVVGLREIVGAILEILPAQGSKALHDEIKVLLKVVSPPPHPQKKCRK